MWTNILQGAAVSGSLIMAIGAQNAFVLKQGLLKQHVFVVAAICFLCDFLLIGVGVMGVGGLIGERPMLQAALALGGAVFLFCYGWRSFRSAFAKNHNALISDENAIAGSLQQTALTTLAMTLLNPHVYIDTVVLVGGIAAPLPMAHKPYFLLGAVAVSFLWFFSLGYGARLLRPMFANPKAWRVLEFLIGAMMWYLALGLAQIVWKLAFQAA